MQTNTVLQTLNETLRELTEKQNQSDSKVVDCRVAVEACRAKLQTAKDKEERAICEDEQAKVKQRDLIDFINSLSEKPQALQEKISALTTEQIKTLDMRQNAHN